MKKISKAIREIHTIDEIAARDQWVNNIHPLVKLCLTIAYIAFVVSFDKYNLMGLLPMFIYPFFAFQLAEVSFKEALGRLKVVLPVVCVVGIFNPFFDREIIGTVYGMGVSGGVISMLSLMLKGIFTVLASYLLIATTTIDRLCYAMRVLHLPKIFVTEIMLIYRYITLLLSEAHKMTQAYSMRAPGQRGVAYKVWGSLIGQLLLRSVDRADNVYAAMNLRGYNGEYYCEKQAFKLGDLVYLLVWLALMILIRFVPVLTLIGGLFT